MRMAWVSITSLDENTLALWHTQHPDTASASSAPHDEHGVSQHFGLRHFSHRTMALSLTYSTLPSRFTLTTCTGFRHSLHTSPPSMQSCRKRPLRTSARRVRAHSRQRGKSNSSRSRNEHMPPMRSRASICCIVVCAGSRRMYRAVQISSSASASLKWMSGRAARSWPNMEEEFWMMRVPMASGRCLTCASASTLLGLCW